MTNPSSIQIGFLSPLHLPISNITRVGYRGRTRLCGTSSTGDSGDVSSAENDVNEDTFRSFSTAADIGDWGVYVGSLTWRAWFGPSSSSTAQIPQTYKWAANNAISPAFGTGNYVTAALAPQGNTHPFCLGGKNPAQRMGSYVPYGLGAAIRIVGPAGSGLSRSERVIPISLRVTGISFQQPCARRLGALFERSR